MAHAFDERNGQRGLRQRQVCARCGGLLVGDGSLDNDGALESGAQRCVQCGEIVDPVIQRNRQLSQKSIADEIGMSSLRGTESLKKQETPPRARVVTFGVTLVVAVAMAGCATDGLQTLSSTESVKRVLAQEAVNQDFGYRQQATLLRERAMSLDFEAQVTTQWADSKEEATILARKARAMRRAADSAEEAAHEYRRQVPHNQVN
jgi:hypothetical protein